MRKSLLLKVLCLGVMLFINYGAFATIHTIQVGTGSGFSFSPSSGLSVQAGDTVEWVWASGTHTTTSGTIPSGAASWNANITSSATTFSYVPTVAGTYNYYCVYHQSMGMTGSFTVTCTAPATPVVTPPNMNICQGTNTMLMASTTTSGVSYQWYIDNLAITGATTDMYMADSAGSYTCKVTNGCGTATSNSVDVTVDPAPDVAFTFNNTSGLTYTFTNTTPGNNIYEWQFGDGDTSSAANPQHTYTATGQYWVVLTAQDVTNGCSATDSMSLSVVSVPTISGNETVTISPNPASSTVTLHTTMTNASLKLYNLAGKYIQTLQIQKKTSKDIFFDVSKVPTGLYLLYVQADGKNSVVKLQVTR